MRILVVFVVLLAGLKVWSQNHAYRTATEAALVRAYQAEAVARCSAKIETAIRGMTLNTATIEIGNPLTDVAFWDWQNPLWQVRFRHPHLVLVSAPPGSQHSTRACHYDLVRGEANFSAL